MTVQVIKVPDIGEGIAQVELVAWHVKPGDGVKEDQALADVMTDKATVEIPSPFAGRIVALGGEVGQVLAVGAELISIERDGAAAPVAPAPHAREATQAAAVKAPEPPVARAPELPVARAATPAAVPKAPEPPVARVAAAAEGPSFALRATEGKPGVRVAAQGSETRARGRPLASPAVRARAWELDVDLNDVAPSGPSGRVTRADVEAHAARGGAAHAAQRTAETAPARPAQGARPAQPAPGSGATHEVKIIGLRRIIAQRMQESKRRIPHYTYVEEIDVTEVEALRAELNAKWSAQRGHLTLLPFLIRAIVRALQEFPQTNARFDDETGVLTQFDAVHVGIATQTDAGLMVPVLRDAQARDLWSCAAEVARLAAAARGGTAVREELSGSTITITSLGRLGGIVSTPVINHPEVAIVGVNKIVTRPVFVGGNIVARQLMNLSCSFDHRVIDGALGAGFVQSVRGLLERPATLFIQ